MSRTQKGTNLGFRIVLHGVEDVVPRQAEEVRVAHRAHVSRAPAQTNGTLFATQ